MCNGRMERQMDGQVDRKSDIEVGAPPKNEGYFKT